MNWRSFLEVWFSQHRWCRRLLGGKWECWWVEPCRSMVWHKVDSFTIDKVKAAKISGYRPDLSDHLNPYWWGYRPSPVCHGQPTVEDWS